MAPTAVSFDDLASSDLETPDATPEQQASTVSIDDIVASAPAKPAKPRAQGTASISIDDIVGTGNIDLTQQPTVPNADGTVSTVDSRSYHIDGKEVLLPAVTQDGRHLQTDAEILAEYKKTGRFLGMFPDVASATAYAQKLHADYASGKYGAVAAGRPAPITVPDERQFTSGATVTPPASALAPTRRRPQSGEEIPLAGGMPTPPLATLGQPGTPPPSGIAGPMPPGGMSFSGTPPAYAVPESSGTLTPAELEVIGRSAPVQNAMQPPAIVPAKVQPYVEQPGRLGSAKTGGAANSGSGTFGTGLAEGAQQFAKGAVAIAPAVGKVGLPGQQGITSDTTNTPEETLNAASDMLEGIAKVATPAMVAGAIMDLPGTAATLFVAWVAAKAAGKTADLAGASPATKRFYENVAATVAAAGGAKRVYDRVQVAAKAAGRAVGQATVPFALAGKLSGEAVGASLPVSKAGIEATQPGAHVPYAAEALDTGGPSSVQLPPGSGPPETLTDIVRTAMAKEPPALKTGEGRDRSVPLAPADVTPAAPLQDEGGRSLGAAAYAGPERRTAETGPPAGQSERRLLPAEQVKKDLRESPETVKAAAAMAAGQTREVEPEQIVGVKQLTHDAASTQVTIPEPHATAFRRYAGQTIKPEDLALNGVETDPHVTIKYGLQGDDPAPVRALLKDEPPVTVTVGKTTHFAGVEDGKADAVVAEVDSPDLHRLNAKIKAALPHTETYPEYRPHITLAMVQHGKGKDYDGDTALEGTTLTLPSVTFSTPDGKTVEIPLSGKQAKGGKAASSDTEKAATSSVSTEKSVQREPVGYTPPPRSTPYVDSRSQTEDDQKVFRTFKARLTRAQNAKDWPQVIAEAKAFDQYYGNPQNPPFPDDWTRWQRAADDARVQLHRAEPTGTVRARLDVGPDKAEEPVAAPPESKEAEPEKPARVPAEAEPAESNPHHATVRYNHTRHSIEVSFPAKPPLDILHGLRADGFKWGKTNKLWYKSLPGPVANETAPAVQRAVALAKQSVGITAAERPQTGTPKVQVEPRTPPTSSKSAPERTSNTDEGKPKEEAKAAPEPKEKPAKVESAPALTGVKSEQEEAPHGTHRAVASGEESAAAPQRPRGGSGTRTRSESGAGAGTEAGAEPRPSPRTGKRRPVSAAAGHDDAVAQADPSLSAPLYRITDADAIGTGTTRERVSRNLAAIRIVKQLAAEQRLATPDEQKILVKYVGWGGLPRIFEPWKNEIESDEKTDYWAEQQRTLESVLTREEYALARNSTQNAHYTSPTVIKAMWDAVQQLGVTSGSALEPSAGIGHFLGLAPDAMRGLTWAMVEKDGITAAIAKALYPSAFVQHAPFQDAALPSDHFAVGVSNVPFGKIPITDEQWVGPPFMRTRVHNYFFGKALDKIAPGGLIAFITSRGTLDSRDNTRVREYLASRADFLGAIRLPYTAFLANAGTQVVTDMVFLRKRHVGAAPAHVAPWIQSVKVMLPDKEGVDVEQHVNEYLLSNPRMVLGAHTSTGTMRRKQAYTVTPPGKTGSEQLAHWKAHGATQLADAVRLLPSNAIDLTPPKESLAAFTAAQAPIGSRPFEFLIHDGKLAQVNEAGMVEPVSMSGADEARVRALLPIRVAVRTLYDLMAEDASDADVVAAQKTLGKVYDAFVKKHGVLSDENNWRAFREDPDIALILSLEDYDEERGTVTKHAIFTTRTKEAERKARTANSPAHALTLSLSESGRIDLDRIGELLSLSPAVAAETLATAGLIVDTPSGWQLPALYLSGNVRVKLAEAQAAAKLDPRYETAAKLLETVIPTTIPAHKINVRLGASWVPVSYVQAFIESVTRGHTRWTVSYTAANAKWSLEGTPSGRTSEYETPHTTTKTILLDALNDQRRTIKRRTEFGTVIDPAATALVRQRKEDLHRAFSNWMLKDDPERRAWAVQSYNERFNAYVEPKIDGSFQTFPGMADVWRKAIATHQRDAIARIVMLGNTLLAHVVGAGKTLEMVAGAMEMKRLGLARKPMFVVPNHLISQAPGQFLSYYPNARVLVATPEDLAAENRKRFTARIAAGDWDAVIMPYSSFVRVSMSREAEMAYQREIMDAIEAAIIQAWADANENGQTQRNKIPPSVKQLETIRDGMQVRLDALAARPVDNMLTFEQLGVDALFVDEAHSFKNLYFPTRQQAAGIPSNNDAQRATDMYLKVRYINKVSNYRNVVLATGTPVSNSMAEIFVMQKLLQEHALERANIAQFDAWLAQFGHIVTETELDPSGTGMSARPRLKSFRNLPDLAAMFRQVTDVKMIDDLPDLKKLRPKLRGGKPEIIQIPIGEEQSQLLSTLKDRAEHLNPKDRVSDNMPMITTDGRMGMLDIRLLDRRVKESKGNKISRVADEVAALYKEHKHHKGTQLVFLDAGTPGSEVRPAFKEVRDANGDWVKRPLTDREKHRGFDLYADLRKKLEKRGVAPTDVAFIHDIDRVPEKKRDAARKALFRKVREGTIRVLVGSTGKMGTGMNVQDRLVALHNVDPTYKPSDIEQRNGRLLRQGNLFAQADPEHFEVRILNYLTTGRNNQFGFDAYMWQLNEAKANIIARFFNGELTERDLAVDLEQTVLTASEMKAIATGNPLVMDLAKATGELQRLQMVFAGWEDAHREAEFNVLHWRQAEAAERAVADRNAATAAAVEDYEPGTPLVAVIDGKAVTGHKNIGTAIIDVAKAATQASAGHPGKWPSYQRPKAVGTLLGLAATVEGNGTTEPHLVLRHPDVDVPRYGSGDADTDYASIRLPLMRPDPDSAGGLDWANPTWLITGAVDKALSLKAPGTWAAYIDEKLASAEAALEKPFEQQADLERVQAEVDRLTQALGLTTQAVNQEGDEEIESDDSGSGSPSDVVERPHANVTSPAPSETRETAPATTSEMQSVQQAATGTPTSEIPPREGLIKGERGAVPLSVFPVEAVAHDAVAVQAWLAPKSVSPEAQLAGTDIVAHNAAKDQVTTRAMRLMDDARKAMDGWSREESLDFIDVMENKASPDILPPDRRQFAVLLRGLLDDWTEALRSRGLVTQFIEHYFPHIWERGSIEGAILRRIFGRRPLAGTESYRKHRTIPDTRTGVAAGLTPVSWNPAVLLQAKIVEMARSVMAYDLRKDWKAHGLRKFATSRKKAPAGWVVDTDRGQVFGPREVTVQPEGSDETVTGKPTFGRLVVGEYYLHPDAARLLQRYLSPGLRGRSLLFDAYNSTAQTFTQLLLGWSSYHIWLTGIEHTISKATLANELASRGDLVGAAKQWAQVGPQGLVYDLARGYKIVKTFYSHNGNANDISGIIGQIINGGGGFGWCVDEETEILTQDGWKRQTDVVVGEMAYTLNPVTKLGEWQPVLAMNRFVGRFDMRHLSGRKHDSLTTGPHRWYTKTKSLTTVKRWRWTTTQELNTNDVILRAAKSASLPTVKVHRDEIVELIAWFFTEGQWTGRGNNVAIYQKRHADMVASCLSRCFGAPTIGSLSLVRGLKRPAWGVVAHRDGCLRFYLNTDAAKTLKAVCDNYTKAVSTTFVLSLTERQLELFVRTALLGDGTVSKKGQATFTQVEPKRLTAFNLAVTLLGHPAVGFTRQPQGGFSKRLQYGVAVSRCIDVRPVMAARQRGVATDTWVTHDGTVWCPSVSNGIWYARRNGKPFFTGNSALEHYDAGGKLMADLRGLLGALPRGDAGAMALKTAAAGVHMPFALIELPTRLIMNHWVPYLKAAAFLDRAEMEMARLKGATLEQQRYALQRAWDVVDDRFGQLRYDNLFWNNAFKQLLMGSFLSVGWQVGSLRPIGRALPGQTKRIINAVGGSGGSAPPGGGGKPPIRMVGGPEHFRPAAEPWLHPDMAWLFTGAFLVGLAGAIYHYLHTGEQPKDLRDYYAPMGADGKRKNLISYAKDYFAWERHPMTTLGHKLTPFLTMLYETYKNEDFFGVELRDSDDPALVQLQDVLQAWLKRANTIAWEQAVKATEDGTFLDHLKEWAAQQASPWRPAPAEISRSAAEELLHSWGEREHSVKTKKQAAIAAETRAIRRAAGGAQAVNIDDIIGSGTLSQRQIETALKSGARQESFLAYSFKQQSLDRALKLYLVATPEERATLQPLLALKAERMLPNAPPADVQGLLDRFNVAMDLPVAVEK